MLMVFIWEIQLSSENYNFMLIWDSDFAPSFQSFNLCNWITNSNLNIYNWKDVACVVLLELLNYT